MEVVKHSSPSSLKAYGIKYEQIELIENNFDIKKIQERLKKTRCKISRNTKIQRIFNKKKFNDRKNRKSDKSNQRSKQTSNNNGR